MRGVITRRLCACLILSFLGVTPAAAYPGMEPLVHAANGDRHTTRTSQPIRLPRDAAAHPNAQTEWWYVTGHLADAQGHTYGFETTFFRLGGIKQIVSGAPSDTILRTDVAVTDETAHRFYSQVNSTLPSPQTTVSSTQLHLHAANLTIQQVGAGLRYRIQSSLPSVSLALTAVSQRPPMLVHGGVIAWGSGSSYYYSLTHMATAGIVSIKGHPMHVQGIAWMDHQWGTWPALSLAGWTWMALQLDDGADISLVNENPATLPQSRWAMGLLPDGRQVYVPDATITPLGSWRSSHTGVRYASGWHVTVPRLHLDVLVRPTVRDQELVDRWGDSRFFSSYWEGSCVVTGTRAGHRVTGKAYTEINPVKQVPQPTSVAP